MYFLSFGSAVQYDSGITPSIAINNHGVVVEVHQSQNNSGLYYRVGQKNGRSIVWGDSHKYDDGVTPAVAITDSGQVIEVHQSQNHTTLYYHVGQISGQTIKFGDSHQYDDGIQPSIAVNSHGVVVEVHKSQNHDTLYYHVGQVSGQTIKFGDSHQYDDGVTPAVAITDSGQVVEVHKSQNHDTLYYHIGQISGQTIKFGDSHQYDDGVSPSIAINNQGNVLEAHSSENHTTLWYHTGQLSGNSLIFDQSREYDTGITPGIAIDNSRNVVEAHQSQNHPTLWCHAGMEVDYSRWMQNNPALHTRKLRNICLPATHDSGTYALQDLVVDTAILKPILNSLTTVAKAIDGIPGIGAFIPDPARWITSEATPAIREISTATRYTIAQQLDAGMRCLDLRVCKNVADNDFYTYHGLLGSKISDILNDVKNFLASTQGEIVYITMGHFYNFTAAAKPGDPDDYTAFAKQVKDALGGYAFKKPDANSKDAAKNLFDFTYNEILADGGGKSRVILVNNNADDAIFWPGGANGYSPPDNKDSNTHLYGFYTDTSDLNTMLAGQQANFQKAVTGGMPCALYMTLTPSTFDAVSSVALSLKGALLKFAGSSALLGHPIIGAALAAIAGGLAVGSAVSSWTTLKELSQFVDKNLTDTALTKFVNTVPSENRISLLYLDYFETTPVVDLAIQLSTK